MNKVFFQKKLYKFVKIDLLSKKLKIDSHEKKF